MEEIKLRTIILTILIPLILILSIGFCNLEVEDSKISPAEQVGVIEQTIINNTEDNLRRFINSREIQEAVNYVHGMTKVKKSLLIDCFLLYTDFGEVHMDKGDYSLFKAGMVNQYDNTLFVPPSYKVALYEFVKNRMVHLEEAQSIKPEDFNREIFFSPEIKNNIGERISLLEYFNGEEN
jgi:hypothetical protein